MDAERCVVLYDRRVYRIENNIIIVRITRGVVTAHTTTIQEAVVVVVVVVSRED